MGRRKTGNEEPEWLKDIPPSAREKLKREEAKFKPAISIDAFRSLMLNALAETEVEREGRKKRIKDKRAKKTGKPEGKGNSRMARKSADKNSQTLEKRCE